MLLIRHGSFKPKKLKQKNTSSLKWLMSLCFFDLCCISNCFGSSHRVPPMSGLPQLKPGAPQLIKSTSALCVFCLVLPFAFLFYFSCFFSSMMWRLIYWGWVFRPPKRPCQPRKGGSFIKPESALLQFIKWWFPGVLSFVLGALFDEGRLFSRHFAWIQGWPSPWRLDSLRNVLLGNNDEVVMG